MIFLAVLISQFFVLPIVGIYEPLVHQCTFSSEKVERANWTEQPKHLMEYPRGSDTGQYVWAPIRITTQFVKFSYSATAKQSFSRSFNVEQHFWDTAKDAVDLVVKELTKMVSVRRLQTPIYFPRQCLRNAQYVNRVTRCRKDETCSLKAFCSHYGEVDEKYADACYVGGQEIHKKGDGFKDVDLVLFVTITDCDVAARAGPCHFEPTFGRPVGGFVQFCYKFLSGVDIKMVGTLRSVAMHELFHVLVHPLDGDYVDENGIKLKDTSVIVDRKWKSQKGVFARKSILSTLPAVRQFARDHFNCPDLEGAEVQNDDIKSVQSDMGHFDQRLFPESIIVPYVYYGAFVSKLDLVLLNSTGWYHSNMNYEAVELRKTKNKGCDFARLSCYEYMEKRNFDNELIYPYCIVGKPYHYSTCSPNAYVSEECEGGVTPISSKDEYYYGNFTGYVMDHKYCPVVKARQLYFSSDDTPLCHVNNPFFGYNSKICARITYSYSNLQMSYSYGICYDYQCNGEQIDLNVGDSSFTCAKDEKGKMVAITNETTLQCPAIPAVCPQEAGKTDSGSVESTGFAIEVIIGAVVCAVLLLIVVIVIIIVVLLHKSNCRIKSAKGVGSEGGQRKRKTKRMTPQKTGKKGKLKDAVGKGTKGGIDKVRVKKRRKN